MSYDLFVDDDNKGQIASNGGWKATAAWLDKQTGELKTLALEGVSTDPKAIVSELNSVISTAPKEVRSILESIQLHANEAVDHIGIGQEGNEPSEALADLSRDVLPHEKKHNFDGHAKRQNQTATAIRRILGGIKTALVHDAARRAATLKPKELDNLTLRFNPTLAGRVTRSVGIAHKYGYDQVYAERFRATGRSKKKKAVRQLLTARKLYYSMKWNGLTLSIENAAGSVRTGRDGSWKMKYKYPYGYIRKTLGADGDHIDCYVGPKEDASNVYVVHQNDHNTGAYDEDKCMLGFDSEESAKKAYIDHHSEGKKAFRSMTTLTLDEFKKAIKESGGSLHFKSFAHYQALAEKSAKQDKPSLIAETALSDLNNSITAKTRGAHVDNYKKGLRDEELEQSIVDDLMEGSDGFLDRIADESARSGVAGGRYDALEELQDEIRAFVRSEAMDANTCDSCEEGDGTEWETLDEVDWSPGDDCDGKDACRGQLMPIFEDEDTVELE